MGKRNAAMATETAAPEFTEPTEAPVNVNPTPTVPVAAPVSLAQLAKSRYIERADRKNAGKSPGKSRGAPADKPVVFLRDYFRRNPSLLMPGKGPKRPDADIARELTPQCAALGWGWKPRKARPATAKRPARDATPFRSMTDKPYTSTDVASARAFVADELGLVVAGTPAEHFAAMGARLLTACADFATASRNVGNPEPCPGMAAVALYRAANPAFTGTDAEALDARNTAVKPYGVPTAAFLPADDGPLAEGIQYATEVRETLATILASMA